MGGDWVRCCSEDSLRVFPVLFAATLGALLLLLLLLLLLQLLCALIERCSLLIFVALEFLCWIPGLDSGPGECAEEEEEAEVESKSKREAACS